MKTHHVLDHLFRRAVTSMKQSSTFFTEHCTSYNTLSVLSIVFRYHVVLLSMPQRIYCIICDDVTEMIDQPAVRGVHGKKAKTIRGMDSIESLSHQPIQIKYSLDLSQVGLYDSGLK